MKSNTILILGLVGLYLFSKTKTTSPTNQGPCPNGQVMTNLGCVSPGSSASVPPTGTTINWVACSDPNADPITCGLLEGM